MCKAIIITQCRDIPRVFFLCWHCQSAIMKYAVFFINCINISFYFLTIINSKSNDNYYAFIICLWAENIIVPILQMEKLRLSWVITYLRSRRYQAAEPVLNPGICSMKSIALVRQSIFSLAHENDIRKDTHILLGGRSSGKHSHKQFGNLL